jgi:hypothetical protein
MSLTQNRVMTQHELVDAVKKSIDFSNAHDAHASRTRPIRDFERYWGRLGAFVTALSLELDAIAPGMFAQVAEFQSDVLFDRNALLAVGTTHQEQDE